MKIKRIITEYLNINFIKYFFKRLCLKTRCEILLNTFIFNFIYHFKNKSVYLKY